MSQQRLGVWLVGARGSVATTAIAGHAAVVDGASKSGVLSAVLGGDVVKDPVGTVKHRPSQLFDVLCS